jgi:hypothetical protein
VTSSFVRPFKGRTLTPTGGNLQGQVRFYERARGQFLDERSKLSGASRSKFDLEYPKQQLIEKTDLAKFLNVWRAHPEIVSRGAQKNFGYFGPIIADEWEKNQDQFNESFFRETIAKAIIFRAMEKIVTAQPWYQGGYRANIVAYAISKVSNDAKSRGLVVNFENVWKAQSLSQNFISALEIAALPSHEVLTDPPTMMKNVTEWAKNQACWNRVKGLEINWPAAWLEDLLTVLDQKEEKRSAVKDQRVLNGIEAQTAVFKAGGKFWQSALAWGSSRKILNQMEPAILQVAAAIPKRVPRDKQSIKLIEILRKMEGEGFQHDGDFA